MYFAGVVFARSTQEGKSVAVHSVLVKNIMAAGDCPWGCSSFSTYYFLLILHFSVWHLFPREIFTGPSLCQVLLCDHRTLFLEYPSEFILFYLSFSSTRLQAKQEPEESVSSAELRIMSSHYRHLIFVQCVDVWTWKAVLYTQKLLTWTFFFIFFFLHHADSVSLLKIWDMILSYDGLVELKKKPLWTA